MQWQRPTLSSPREPPQLGPCHPKARAPSNSKDTHARALNAASEHALQIQEAQDYGVLIFLNWDLEDPLHVNQAKAKRRITDYDTPSRHHGRVRPFASPPACFPPPVLSGKPPFLTSGVWRSAINQLFRGKTWRMGPMWDELFLSCQWLCRVPDGLARCHGCQLT